MILTILQAAMTSASNAANQPCFFTENKEFFIILIGCITVGWVTREYFNWKKHDCDQKVSAAEKVSQHENEITKAKRKADLQDKILEYKKIKAEAEKGEGCILRPKKDSKEYVTVIDDCINTLENYLNELK